MRNFLVRISLKRREKKQLNEIEKIITLGQVEYFQHFAVRVRNLNSQTSELLNSTVEEAYTELVFCGVINSA